MKEKIIKKLKEIGIISFFGIIGVGILLSILYTLASISNTAYLKLI